MSKKKMIEQIYNSKLKDVEKYYTGDKTTYLSELNGAGHKLFGVKYKGTFASDKIPKLNDLAPYAILNLDSSKEPGSHWIAVAKSKKGNYLICYDSFGRKNSNIIPKLKSSGNGRIVDTEKDAEQKFQETNCGARCLAFLCIFNDYGEDLAKLI